MKQRLRQRTVADQLPVARFLESVSCQEDAAGTAEGDGEVVWTTLGFGLPHDGPFEIAERELGSPTMSRFLQGHSVRKDEQGVQA